MDVYIQSEIGICQEFMQEKGKKKEAVSIVVSPLRVQGDDTGMNLRVINGCNMWQSCCNSNCFFSVAARTVQKVRAAPNKE